MKRKIIVIRLVIIAIVVLAAVMTLHFNKPSLREDLTLGNCIKTSVEQSLQKAEYTTIDLNEIAAFKWDTLYIVKPFPMVMRIPAHPDGESGNIRTRNRKYPDTLPANLIVK